MKKAKKLFLFLSAGLPSFLIAVPLNWFFVQTVHLAEPLAYAIVLLVQVSVNFVLCRWFVFQIHAEKSFCSQYFHFLAGISLFRLADWGLYSLVTHFFDFYYIAVQLFNVVFFALLKFSFVKSIMESKGKPPSL
jgi:putative flippase GtrA